MIMRLIVIPAIMVTICLPCALMPFILLIFLYPSSSSSLAYFGQPSPSQRNPSFNPVNPLSILSAMPAKVSKKWWKFHDRNLGHTDSTMSEGLHDNSASNDEESSKPSNEESSKPSNSTTKTSKTIIATDDENEEEVPEDESAHIIKLDDMQTALATAQSLVNQSTAEIIALGWKLVHEGKQFGLFKRRQKRANGEDGAVEYLMMGQFQDISPFTFLLGQIDRSCRQLWDKTMKEMSLGNITLSHSSPNHDSNEPSTAATGSHVQIGNDMLYYRTKWPWPLKDRDYTLARRVKIFDDANAIMLTSKSAEDLSVPAVDGVIRVDNYWCNAVVFSQPSNGNVNTARHALNDASSSSEEAATAGESSRESNGDMSEGSSETAVQVTSSTLHQYFFHNPLLRRRHPSNTHIINYRLLRRMQRLQRRYQDELRTLKRNVIIPTATREHIKWKLKREMLQRQIDVIRGWKETVDVVIGEAKSVFVVADKEPLQQSLNDAEADEPLLQLTQEEEEQQRSNTASKRKRRKGNNTLNRHGLKFVTIFCDDQRVPLHPRIVDALSSMGEKMVPDSIAKLHEVALDLEKKYTAQDSPRAVEAVEGESTS